MSRCNIVRNKPRSRCGGEASFQRGARSAEGWTRMLSRAGSAAAEQPSFTQLPFKQAPERAFDSPTRRARVSEARSAPKRSCASGKGGASLERFASTKRSRNFLRFRSTPTWQRSLVRRSNAVRVDEKMEIQPNSSRIHVWHSSGPSLRCGHV